MMIRRMTRLVAVALVPLTLIAVAGILLVRVPATGPAALPDPAAMAAIGDGRQSAEEIVDHWSSKVDAAPNVSRYRTQLAQARLTLAGDTGDLEGFQEAEQIIRDVLADHPEEPGALLTLAASRSGQHDFRGALELVEAVLASDPDSIDALLAVGDAQLALGDYDGAASTFTLASAELGGSAPILSRLARLEADVGSLDEARDLAERALVDAGEQDLRHADAAFYWFQLASYDFAAGDVDRAFEQLESTLAIDPGNPGATELLGRVLVARGEITAAIELYESLTDGGGAADLHGELAQLYEFVGRSEEAAEQIALGLAVAAETADRFPAERRHLIGFLVDHDPEEALRLARLDLEDRADVRAHSWLAWALFRSGDVDGAREALDAALAHGTEDASLLYQAGVILHASGEHEAGAGLIERALQLNPGFDLIEARHAASLLASLPAR